MLDISTISAVSAVVAAVGVFVGVALAYLEVRSLVKARQAEVFMDLQSNFVDPLRSEKWLEVWYRHRDWKNYDDWHKKYGPEGDLEAFSSWQIMANYYESIGRLVIRKLIDIDFAHGLLGVQYVTIFWERYEPVIKGLREQYEIPLAWKAFEYLYNEIMQRKPILWQTQQ